jgi:putative ABC transport system substrate-binding protein
VIVAGGNAAALAAKAATATIPIVFATGEDPINIGLVPSLNRPEGNVTGIFFYSGTDLQSKQLELLREVVPNTRVIGVLVNPKSPQAEFQATNAQEAARALAGC